MAPGIRFIITSTILAALAPAADGRAAPPGGPAGPKTVHVASGIGTFVQVDGDDVQGAIDRACPGDTVIADPRRELLIAKSIVIDKPLTLTGLRARLHEKSRGTALVRVMADDVRVSDFHLTGNRGSGAFEERASLLFVRGSRFVIERGIVQRSSMHGICVETHMEDPLAGDIRDGVIRDITGFDNERDHVSLTGSGHIRLYVRNVVVERIRAYRSGNRGAVEVSDGTENITVRDIYAEDCRYGVDLQDHHKRGMAPAQWNIGIVVENVFVRRCRHAVRASTSPGMGHRNHLIRNISGTEWEAHAIPIIVNHARNVHLDTVRIDGNGEPIHAGVLVLNSGNVTAREITIQGTPVLNEAILIEDSTDVRIVGAYIDTVARAPDSAAIRFRLQSAGEYRNLVIREITAPGPVNRILLEASRPGSSHPPYHARRFTGEGLRYEDIPELRGGLASYRIHHPSGLVEDRLGVPDGRILIE